MLPKDRAQLEHLIASYPLELIAALIAARARIEARNPDDEPTSAYWSRVQRTFEQAASQCAVAEDQFTKDRAHVEMLF
jgi:hypothetical protein